MLFLSWNYLDMLCLTHKNVKFVAMYILKMHGPWLRIFFIDVQNIAYLITYCSKNGHKSSVPFWVMACSRKCVMYRWTDEQMRPKTIVTVLPLWPIQYKCQFWKSPLKENLLPFSASKLVYENLFKHQLPLLHLLNLPFKHHMPTPHLSSFGKNPISILSFTTQNPDQSFPSNLTCLKTAPSPEFTKIIPLTPLPNTTPKKIPQAYAIIT